MKEGIKCLINIARDYYYVLVSPAAYYLTLLLYCLITLLTICMRLVVQDRSRIKEPYDRRIVDDAIPPVLFWEVEGKLDVLLPKRPA